MPQVAEFVGRAIVAHAAIDELPGPDWPGEAPYVDERDKQGRPRSCPALVVDAAGRRWRYVGGLVEGAPRYEETRDA